MYYSLFPFQPLLNCLCQTTLIHPPASSNNLFLLEYIPCFLDFIIIIIAFLYHHNRFLHNYIYDFVRLLDSAKALAFKNVPTRKEVGYIN